MIKERLSNRILRIIEHKNLIWRLFLLVLLLAPLFFIKEFYEGFIIYLPGKCFIKTIRNQWHLVTINIIFFISFLIPISYRRKVNWTEYGLVGAFFISLFIEMYGIPLSLIFLSRFISIQTSVPKVAFSYRFLGVKMGVDINSVYGTVLIAIGMFIIIIGWITLYRNRKEKGLVKTGIYSHSRHPQYMGFILIIVGWFLGWPTLLTIILSPILIYKYINISIIEEKEILEEFPEYKDYKKRVPFFI